MDHLQLPQSATSPYPRIPYICEHLDECHDFFTYAAEYADKWNVDASSASSATLHWLFEAAEGHGTAEVESFLQRWIFFGLLKEIFGPLGLFNAADYIESDANGTFVHTKTLTSTAESWRDAVRAWDTERLLAAGVKLHQCLKYAASSLYGMYGRKRERRADLDYSIQISVQVILDTVSGMADTRLLLPSEHAMWLGEVRGLVLTESVVDYMLSNGWCRSEMKYFDREHFSVSSQLFMSRLPRQTDDIEHSGCTEEVCTQLQIKEIHGRFNRSTSGELKKSEDTIDAQKTTDPNDMRYKPRHARKLCTCESLGPSPAEVAECLVKSSFPLLRVRGSSIDDVTLEVVPYEAGVPYVALSHVWADGLGNPDTTQLPRCQALRLRKLLQRITGHVYTFGEPGVERREERELLLWCDTYCCPTEKEDRGHRELALACLQRVYTEAAYVLVLDRELAAVSYASIGVIERAIRLMTSRWTKRLWTFQEGAIPGKLLIQFADKPVDFRAIWEDLVSLEQTSLMHLRMARELILLCVRLRIWCRGADSNMNRMLLLMMAVAHRSVTKASDEPLCLAVVLGLDVEEVAKVNGSGRMEIFWQLASNSKQGISSDLIFSNLPRLTTKGFRWALASFKVPPNHPEVHVLSSRRSTTIKWTPDGALYQGRGWRVQLEQPVWGLGETDNKIPWFSDVVRDTYGNGYLVGKPYNFDDSAYERIWDRVRDRHRDWYMVLNDKIGSSEVQRALLAYKERGVKADIYRSVCVFSISELPSDMHEYENLVRVRVSAIQKHRIVWLLQVQQLCKSIARILTIWMPFVICSRVLPTIMSFIALIFSGVNRRYERLIAEHAQEAAQLKGVEQAARKYFSKDSPVLWKARIRCKLRGVDIVVAETYESSREWIID